MGFVYTDQTSINPDFYRSDGAIHQAAPWRYRYDGHGHLRNTASSDYQSQTNYNIDALGERFWTSHYDDPAGAQVSVYAFSDGLRPETVSEPTYSRPSTATSTWTVTGTRSYVLGPLPDEWLIWMEGRGDDRVVSYPHTDRRGSTIAISRGGQAVTTYAYDEFGQGRPQDGITGYPFRYTGQRLDPWTGTYHYKAREYSPNLGRFLQPDPARFVDGPNVYAYVGNNPWNATDPTGRTCVITGEGRRATASCIVDDHGGVDAERIAVLERNYTAAVNRLLRAGPREVRVQMGRRVSAAGIARVLASMEVVADPRAGRAGAEGANSDGSDPGGHERGQRIRMYSGVFNSDPHGNRSRRSIDLGMQNIFVHEGIHMDPSEPRYIGGESHSGHYTYLATKLLAPPTQFELFFWGMRGR